MPTWAGARRFPNRQAPFPKTPDAVCQNAGQPSQVSGDHGVGADYAPAPAETSTGKIRCDPPLRYYLPDRLRAHPGRNP